MDSRFVSWCLGINCESEDVDVCVRVCRGGVCVCEMFKQHSITLIAHFIRNE